VVPEPRKRPRSSCLRFAAEQPSECWQSGFIHYPLAGGTGTGILTWLDDHSRYALRVTAHSRVTGPIVLAAFRAAIAAHGAPASNLTDNGMVFTTRFCGGRGGRNGLESALRRRGIKQKNGKASHPQTQGKAERFQPTLKNWLAAQHPQPPAWPTFRPSWTPSPPAATTSRPHRSLPHRATPATACTARHKAVPGDRAAGTHDRVRTDTAGKTGTLTLRHGGRLCHIGAGRAYARTHIILLLQDLDVRIINAATSELLRQLILDPSRNYQPTGRPPGPTTQHPADANTPDPNVGSGCPR
jgi:hypothetical protein